MPDIRRVTIALSEITSESLPTVKLKVSEIWPQDAAKLLAKARDAEGITIAYDFGPVPDKRLEARFIQLLEACSRLGMDLSNEVEVARGQFSPPRFYAPAARCPLLVIQYALTLPPRRPGAIGVPLGEIVLPTVKFRMIEYA
ncbi:hypothetical protein ACEUZ9_004079 [Paracoccus litorisediminis]|uniref:hypothetical protein n=1 Tax=Paracoccus litorisediminis TaxID=2006130 RepID=UPI003731B909